MSKTVLNGLTAGYSSEYCGWTFYYYDNDSCGIKIRVKNKTIHSLGSFESNEVAEKKMIIQNIFKEHHLNYNKNGLIVKKDKKKYFFCLCHGNYNYEITKRDWNNKRSKYLFVHLPEGDISPTCLRWIIEKILTEEELST